ncbi:MAG: TRC40/GET3/ArsA family transport-energizing ATPase [Gemmatimonadales bacterium]
MVESASQLLHRRLVFFGGKGGTGKTTLAAAFALQSADDGKRTLLVSTDTAHSTSDILEAELGPEPSLVSATCWALEIDPEQETARYIVSGTFDRIVFDTAPTGQTLRLLSLPELMSAWIGGLISSRKKVNSLSRMWRKVAGAAAGDEPSGADPVLEALEDRQKRFHHTRQLLTDSGETAFVFVVTPERLPIAETEKAVTTLVKYRIPVGAVFVNRVLPPDAESDFLDRRRERETVSLERIQQGLEAHPIYIVRLRDGDVVGVDSLMQLGAEMLQLRSEE